MRSRNFTKNSFVCQNCPWRLLNWEREKTVSLRRLVQHCATRLMNWDEGRVPRDGVDINNRRLVFKRILDMERKKMNEHKRNEIETSFPSFATPFFWITSWIFPFLRPTKYKSSKVSIAVTVSSWLSIVPDVVPSLKIVNVRPISVPTVTPASLTRYLVGDPYESLLNFIFVVKILDVSTLTMNKTMKHRRN